MVSDIDRSAIHIAAMLMSEDLDNAIEGARQLRMLTIQNRFGVL